MIGKMNSSVFLTVSFLAWCGSAAFVGYNRFADMGYRVSKSAWTAAAPTGPYPSSAANSFATCAVECGQVNCSSFALTSNAGNNGLTCAFGDRGQTLAVQPYSDVVETMDIWAPVAMQRGDAALGNNAVGATSAYWLHAPSAIPALPSALPQFSFTPEHIIYFPISEAWVARCSWDDRTCWKWRLGLTEWVSMAPLLYRHFQATTCHIDLQDGVMFLGGQDPADSANKTLTEIYDIPNNIWHPGPNTATLFQQAGCVGFGGRYGLIAGGVLNNLPMDKVYLYDLEAGTFKELVQRLDDGGRYDMACGRHETVANGTVVVCIGGVDSTLSWSTKTWLYSQETGHFGRWPALDISCDACLAVNVGNRMLLTHPGVAYELVETGSMTFEWRSIGSGWPPHQWAGIHYHYIEV